MAGPDRLKQGGKSSIKAHLATGGQKGPVRETIEVVSNDPARPRVMLEVKDNRTGEVIRTIPSKELLDLSARIGEMVGVFLDKKG